MSPKITVLMSVYNAEKYLRECIDSILAQTFKDFEFVIYDDCSTDGSRAILESYSDNRIVLRRNTVNRGLTVNLEEGMRLSKADFVARMDADDIAKPERFAEQLEYFDEHPDVTILGTQVDYFDNEGKFLCRTSEPEGHEDIKVQLFVSFSLYHPTVMFRMEKMREFALNYDPSFRYAQDHDLWFRSMTKVRLANHPNALMRMRAHSSSISKAKHGLQQECADRGRKAMLRRIGIQLTETELEAYNALAQHAYSKIDARLLATFLSFSERITSANEVEQVFNSAKLRRKLLSCAFQSAYHILRHLGRRDCMRIFLASPFTKEVPPYDLKMWTKIRVLLMRATVFEYVQQGFFSKLYKKVRSSVLRELKLRILPSLKSALYYNQIISAITASNSRRVLLVEFNPYHGEVLLGIYLLLQSMGYTVLVVANKGLNGRFGSPFCTIPDAPIVYLPLGEILHLLSLDTLSCFEFVFVTTCVVNAPELGITNPFCCLYPNGTCAKRGYVALVHDLSDVMATQGPLNRCRYAALNAWPDYKEYPMIAPVSFGAVNERAKSRPKVPKFVTVGRFESSVRDVNILETWLNGIHPETKFEIHVIGSYDSASRARFSDKRLIFHGRVPFDVLYRICSECEFILPLLNDSIPSHQPYRRSTTTGSRQLILGFELLPVIQKPFAAAYRFDERNAFIYDGNDMSGAMQCAIDARMEELESMRANLRHLRREVDASSKKALLSLLNSLL